MYGAIRIRRGGEQDRLLMLYRSAGEMEATLRTMAEHDVFAYLTEPQVREFNQLVEAARRMVPDSVALKEDIDPIDDEDDEVSAANAFRALHVTLLPALHNALPENQYAVA